MARGKRQTVRPVPAFQVGPGEWPANAIEQWPIEKIRPHPRNGSTARISAKFRKLFLLVFNVALATTTARALQKIAAKLGGWGG
jgi:hypothetical protein